MTSTVHRNFFWGFSLVLCLLVLNQSHAENQKSNELNKSNTPSLLPSVEKAKRKMRPYKLKIPQTKISFEMIPISGGQFLMGSPETENFRHVDEGPRHEVKIEPFWMGKYEVTWDEYDLWAFDIDIKRRINLSAVKATDRDKLADAVTRPSTPYLDFTMGYGHDRYPAMCVTQLAAKTYCQWLSAKTGHFYRLPTEAEWEYACRAGTKTAYSFGNNSNKIGDYAWHEDNSDFELHAVGLKKPNPWGLYDMHGNVAEWCLDKYDEGYYHKYVAAKNKPLLNVPTLKQQFGRVVRGGSWLQKPKELRSASRAKSHKDWNQQDPQIPQSVW